MLLSEELSLAISASICARVRPSLVTKSSCSFLIFVVCWSRASA